VYQAGLEITEYQWFNELQIDRNVFLDNLWLHDLSKFSANESFGYAFNDFSKSGGSLQFQMAWQHHKCFNPHHPEHWYNPNRAGEINPLPMPMIYVTEMVADWIGSGRSYGTAFNEWLPKNIDTFKWNQKTRERLDLIIQKLNV
jgi:hypothetical protein